MTAVLTSTGQDQGTNDTHRLLVLAGAISEQPAIADAIPNPPSRAALIDPSIYLLAQFLDDIEGLRKAQDNRKRILTTDDPDSDGEMRGFGLDATHPVVATIAKLSEGIDAVELQTILALNRAMRANPLASWQKAQKGVGEKQFARLLAATGDPYINANTGQPRTVSQLWAYCGYHTLATDDGQVAAKRRKGQVSNWSTAAKTRAYLIATSCIKQMGGEYRAVYDARRAHTATSHEDWTDGHSHNDALRIVAKVILRDMWRAAREYHEGTDQ